LSSNPHPIHKYSKQPCLSYPTQNNQRNRANTAATRPISEAANPTELAAPEFPVIKVVAGVPVEIEDRDDPDVLGVAEPDTAGLVIVEVIPEDDAEPVEELEVELAMAVPEMKVTPEIVSEVETPLLVLELPVIIEIPELPVALAKAKEVEEAMDAPD
jgi:hypothetical protein